MDLWTKSIGTTNSDQYATAARDLLTISAQARLLTYKDSTNQSIKKVSDQLTTFVGSEAPASFSLDDLLLVDENTVETTVIFTDNTTSKKIFTTKSEGGVWLIDTVRDWTEGTH